MEDKTPGNHIPESAVTQPSPGNQTPPPHPPRAPFIAMGTTIAVLTLAVFVLGAYIASEKLGTPKNNFAENNSAENTSENTPSNDSATAPTASDSFLPPAFDASKLLSFDEATGEYIDNPSEDLNAPDDSYDSQHAPTGIHLLDSSGPIRLSLPNPTPTNILKLTFDPDQLEEYISLAVNPYKDGLEIFDTSEWMAEEVAFSKNIASIYYGRPGNGLGNDTIFVLLEDGTIEYIPVVYAFYHFNEGGLKSYGRLAGVNDVIRFSEASTFSARLILALRSDGKYYDIGSSAESLEQYYGYEAFEN